jgi:hypothetical protein
MGTRGEVGEDSSADSRRGKGGGGILHRGHPSRWTDTAASSIEAGQRSWGGRAVRGGPGGRKVWEEDEMREEDKTQRKHGGTHKGHKARRESGGCERCEPSGELDHFSCTSCL